MGGKINDPKLKKRARALKPERALNPESSVQQQVLNFFVDKWGVAKERLREWGGDVQIAVEVISEDIDEVLNENNLEKIAEKFGETVNYIEQKIEDFVELPKKTVMESLKDFFVEAGKLIMSVDPRDPEKTARAYIPFEKAANDLYDAIGRAVSEKQSVFLSWVEKNTGSKRESGLLSQPIKQGTKKPTADVIKKAKEATPKTPKGKTAQDIAASSKFGNTKKQKGFF